MKRGDLVTIVTQGDYGKPRPALVIQSDFFTENLSLTVLPITSHLVDAPLLRINLEASAQTNLNKPSQVMVDKITTVQREKAGLVFGSISHKTMVEIERCLSVFIGLG
ncbi:MAG: type II toxin-antitoxin system PemK/MazF family toxin [Mariprofundaceae bacterium]|nr:type II toxin-antitoxin system PemK/MazF family toxin [Mariprofundaceae bacterium]